MSCVGDPESPVDPADDSEAAPAGPPPTAALTPEERFAAVREHYLNRIASSPTGTVAGTVRGLDNAPLAGVTVRIGKHATVTDASGHYAVAEVAVGNQVVTFEHPRYVITQRPSLVVPSYAPAVDVSLIARSTPQHINADRGGVVSAGPLALTFEPDDLAFLDGRPVHGQIDVMVTAVDPRIARHIEAAPARLEGIDVKGNQVGLFSYGMAEIEVSQAGQQLQVRAGHTVTAAMNIAGIGPKVDAIPMWHHDLELGLWVQEPSAESFANVPRVGVAVVAANFAGAPVATTELPHFSTWNWDGISGATCTNMSVPSKVPLQALRVVSTDSLGNLDNLWTMNAQCLPPRGTMASGYATTCIGDSPSGAAGFGLLTSFKYQGQANGVWCDLTVGYDGVAKTLLMGADINAWLTEYNYTEANAWCGTPAPGNGQITGTINLAYPPALTPNHVAFVVTGSSCPTLIGPGSGDGGFAAMQANTLSPSGTFYKDIDRDGAVEGHDNCPASSGPQIDSNHNGIGDACESWCNIPLTDPYSMYYDFDRDGIDDLCDNRYTIFNPSQYVPTF